MLGSRARCIRFNLEDNAEHLFRNGVEVGKQEIKVNDPPGLLFLLKNVWASSPLLSYIRRDFPIRSPFSYVLFNQPTIRTSDWDLHPIFEGSSR